MKLPAANLWVIRSREILTVNPDYSEAILNVTWVHISVPATWHLIHPAALARCRTVTDDTHRRTDHAMVMCRAVVGGLWWYMVLNKFSQITSNVCLLLLLLLLLLLHGW